MEPPQTQNLVVYVDESGNAGDGAMRQSGGPFDDQPSFALVGVAEEEGAHKLEAVLARVRAITNTKASEIKSRSMNRYPALFGEIVGLLDDIGVPVFIELMDKRYYIASNIVQFAVGGEWLDHSIDESRIVAAGIADILTEIVDPRALFAYSQFAREPTEETFKTFRDVFLDELASAHERTRVTIAKRMLTMITEAFQEAVELCQSGRTYAGRPSFTRLLPPPDRTLKTGKIIAMLPHVPALTNLFARLNCFSERRAKVRVVHDEQPQFASIFRGYASLLESNEYREEIAKTAPRPGVNWNFPAGKFSLEFAKSQETPGIQIADILARCFTRCLNADIRGERTQDLEAALRLAA